MAGIDEEEEDAEFDFGSDRDDYDPPDGATAGGAASTPPPAGNKGAHKGGPSRSPIGSSGPSPINLDSDEEDLKGVSKSDKLLLKMVGRTAKATTASAEARSVEAKAAETNAQANLLNAQSAQSTQAASINQQQQMMQQMQQMQQAMMAQQNVMMQFMMRGGMGGSMGDGGAGGGGMPYGGMGAPPGMPMPNFFGSAGAQVPPSSMPPSSGP